ncbi:MAG: DinB family protein [Bacteroidia bacterium]|nr:DinB family protein [Bacteroidia bacterium]
MNSKLQHLFDSLEVEKNTLLASIKNVSPEKLQQAQEGKWSINQILAHLIAAEKLSVQYLNKKMLGLKDAGDTGIWEEIKLVVLQVSQRLPLRFKAPRAVVESTPMYSNMAELQADWDNTRAELKNLLEKFDETQLQKKIYKHIFAGRLNIQHGLVFLKEHMMHHRPQISRLLK